MLSFPHRSELVSEERASAPGHRHERRLSLHFVSVAGAMGLCLWACGPVGGEMAGGSNGGAPGVDAGAGGAEGFTFGGQAGLAPPPVPEPPPTETNNCGVKAVVPTKRGASVVIVADSSKNSSQGVRLAYDTLDDLVEQQDLSRWALLTTPEGTERLSECGVRASVDFGSTVARWQEALGEETGLMRNSTSAVAAAIEKAVALLKARNDGTDRFIVLLTSGEVALPSANFCGNDLPQEALASALSQGIRTYVLGGWYQPMQLAPSLTELAEAGGTARPGNTKYYSSESSDVRTVFVGVSERLNNCRLALGEVPPVPDNILVKVGDTKIAFGSEDGWVYEGAETIVLQGQACSQVSASSQPLSVLFGCPGIPVL